MFARLRRCWGTIEPEHAPCSCLARISESPLTPEARMTPEASPAQQAEDAEREDCGDEK